MKKNDTTAAEGKKLVLGKETIRQLDDFEVEQIAGGTGRMPTSEQPRCTQASLCNNG